MTELISTSPLLVWAGAGAVAAILVGAVEITRRARAQKVAADHRLEALYREIDAIVGAPVDRSPSGSWREQAAEALRRAATPPRSAPQDEAHEDRTSAAHRALAAAAAAIDALEQTSEAAGIVTALRLGDRVAESRDAIGSIGSGEIETALETGVFNDVLTTAPLLAVYFSSNPELACVREAYGLAAASIRFALAECGVAVEMPSILSIVSGPEARGGMDGRELRRIPQARALANRAADRLGPGESLIVYCSVPGWTSRSARRAPRLVFWNAASWLA